MTSILYGVYHAALAAGCLLSTVCIAVGVVVTNPDDFDLAVGILLLGSILSACVLFWGC